MMRYFLVSSIILLFTSCAATSGLKQNVYAPSTDNRLWTDELRNNETLNSYQVSIQVRGNEITGTCMLKKSEDGWRGTLVNTFGIKAFDFIVTPQKCELLHTIALLDKWYIRRTIAGDLHFLFEADNPEASFQKKTVRSVEQGGILMVRWKKKNITRIQDDKLILQNQKRKIVYFLNKTPE